MFGALHDRWTRSKLQELIVFLHNCNHIEKIQQIKASFMLVDFIQVANILNLEISTDAYSVCDTNLTTLNNLIGWQQNIVAEN